MSLIDPFADYSMSGKVAVITGGASGLGACSAELLAGAGAAVVLGDVDEAGAEKHAAKIREAGGRAVAQSCDVRRRSEHEALVDLAVAEFGRLDVYANVAGTMGNTKLVVDVEEADLDLLYEINQKGTYFGCQAALRVMIPQGSGSIVNVSSASIDYPMSNVSAYAMTKAAVAMLTQELAMEVGQHGIRVNCIAPGQTPTNFNAAGRALPDGSPDPEKWAMYRERGASMSPIGRLGEAIDQGHLVLYLASEAAKFCTGAIFRANGGVGIVW